MDRETVDKIIELSKTKTTKAIALELNLPYDAVRWKIRTLGLSTKAPHVRSKEEIEAIIYYQGRFGSEKTRAHYSLSADALDSILRRVKKKQAKFIKEIDTEAIRKLRWAAFAYANRCGLNEHAEDFASYVVLNKLRGKGIVLEYQAINFKREQFGNINNDKGDARAKGQRFAKSISHTGTIEDDDRASGTVVEVAAPPKEQLLGILDDLRLDKFDRAALVLYYYWGFTSEEIGGVFGVTGCAISQVLAKTHSLIEKRLRNESRKSLLSPL